MLHKENAQYGFRRSLLGYPMGSASSSLSKPVYSLNDCRLIVVTGAERPAQGSVAVASGAADFLPIDDLTPRALSRACAHALMRSRLEREAA
jgi:hypothetical protein